MVRGQFKLNLIGVLAGTMTGYGTQLVLTGGGPGFSSIVPGLYMYNQAFGSFAGGTSSNYGYASAVGLILFIVSVIITIVAFKYVRSVD